MIQCFSIVSDFLKAGYHYSMDFGGFGLALAKFEILEKKFQNNLHKPFKISHFCTGVTALHTP